MITRVGDGGKHPLDTSGPRYHLVWFLRFESGSLESCTSGELNYLDFSLELSPIWVASAVGRWLVAAVPSNLMGVPLAWSDNNATPPNSGQGWRGRNELITR